MWQGRGGEGVALAPSRVTTAPPPPAAAAPSSGSEAPAPGGDTIGATPMSILIGLRKTMNTTKRDSDEARMMREYLGATLSRFEYFTAKIAADDAAGEQVETLQPFQLLR